MRFATARVQVVDAMGTPAAGLRVTMLCAAEPPGWQDWTTDADGWVTIEQVPPGAFHLLVENPDGPARAGRRDASLGDARLGPFEVASDQTRAELRAVLPEGWR
jgi:hypothetical protein